MTAAYLRGNQTFTSNNRRYILVRPFGAMKLSRKSHLSSHFIYSLVFPRSRPLSMFNSHYNIASGQHRVLLTEWGLPDISSPSGSSTLSTGTIVISAFFNYVFQKPIAHMETLPKGINIRELPPKQLGIMAQRWDTTLAKGLLKGM